MPGCHLYRIRLGHSVSTHYDLFMTLIEAIAVLFGIICVWLTIRQNIWCWPTGLIQVLLFIYIFYSVKLYSDLILHVIYVGLQFYGWHQWLRGGRDHGKLSVTHMSYSSLSLWCIIVAVGTLIWGYLMARNTDAALPYPDAFTTVASLTAQWLMAKKRLQSWLFWIAVDVIAIGVYFYKELYLTTGLYAVFLIMATLGFFAWRKDLTTIENTAAQTA